MKHALIIAGSRGLGSGLVREYLSRGWHVTATARTPSDELVALHRDAAERLVIESLDVTVVAQAAALAVRLNGQSFDLLFLNPGIMAGSGAALSDVPDGDIQNIFLTNAIGPIRVADALAHLVVPGGTIAFMSSERGSISTNDGEGTELYRASKAALNSMTNSFVTQLGEQKMTVLSLHPGWVKTDMGGEGADLDVETSTRGLVDQVNAYTGKGGHHFINYKGETIPW